MKKKQMIWICLAILCMLSVVLASCGGPDAPADAADNGAADTPSAASSYVWGSAAMGSTGYVIMEAFCSTLNKYLEGIQNSSISTGGSSENMLLIGTGDVQFGHMTSLDYISAKEGTGAFTEPVEAYQVFCYQSWAQPLVVLNGVDIYTLDDLKGKKVCVGAAGSGSANLWEAVLKEAGIFEEVDVQYLSFSEGKDALVAGQIDACSATFANGGSSPASTFIELAASNEFHIVNCDAALLERMEPYGIFPGTIKAGTMEFLTEDYTVPMYPGALAVSPGVPEDDVYQIVKTLFEHEEEVQAIATELQLFSLDDALGAMLSNIPVHPGAVKYYQEAGIWDDSLLVGE